MDLLATLLQERLRLPEDRILLPSQADTDLVNQHYRKWGFTLYRTAYGPTSDQNWLALVDRIHAQMQKEVMARAEDLDTNNTSSAVAVRFLSLFRLDARSDAASLDDATIEQVRHLYQNSGGSEVGGEGEPMNATGELCQRRVFLVADEEVLAGVAAGGDFWVKCVQADYEAANFVPRNKRAGAQRYFGWMKMTTRSLFELWARLDSDDLPRIAPQTIGGMHLVTWDGDLAF